MNGSEVVHCNLEEARSLAFVDMSGLWLDLAHPEHTLEAFAARFINTASLEGAVLPNGKVLPGVESLFASSDNSWRTILSEFVGGKD
jgi:hypothetical protein